MFLVGRANEFCQASLDEEIKSYADILQANIPDDYEALPDKVLSAYQWIFYRKNNLSEFYAFVDDDCAVNIIKFFDYTSARLLELTREKKILCGYRYTTGQPPSR